MDASFLFCWEPSKPRGTCNPSQSPTISKDEKSALGAESHCYLGSNAVQLFHNRTLNISKIYPYLVGRMSRANSTTKKTTSVLDHLRRFSTEARARESPFRLNRNFHTKATQRHHSEEYTDHHNVLSIA